MTLARASRRDRRHESALALLCAAAFALLPWYLLQDGFWSFDWRAGYRNVGA